MAPLPWGRRVRRLRRQCRRRSRAAASRAGGFGSGRDDPGCACRSCARRRAYGARRRKFVGHGADEEIRRLDALCRENIEDLLAVGRQRAIVEGEHDLLVAQRHGLGVLHHAKAPVLAGIRRRARGSFQARWDSPGNPGRARAPWTQALRQPCRRQREPAPVRDACPVPGPGRFAIAGTAPHPVGDYGPLSLMSP